MDRMRIRIATDTLIPTVTLARTMAASIGGAVMGSVGNIANMNFVSTDSAVASTDFVAVSMDSAAANTADTTGKP